MGTILEATAREARMSGDTSSVVVRRGTATDGPTGTRGFFCGPGAGKPLTLPGMQMVLKASARQTNAALSLFETEDEPGLSPPPHIHQDASEAFYVLEGDYEMTVDGETATCGSGSLIFIPPGVEHGFTAGTRTARKLIVFVPGAMESYFEEMDTAVRAGAVSAEQQAAIALRANMVVVTPVIVERS